MAQGHVGKPLMDTLQGQYTGSVELSQTAFLFLVRSFEACCSIPLKVNGIHGGDRGDSAGSSFCALYQDLSPWRPMWEKLLFIAPGRCIKGPMNFNLGLDHPGNAGHGQSLALKRARLQSLKLS